MNRAIARAAILVVALAGTGAARADFVSVLQPTPIAMSTAVAFQNSNVIPGTTTPDGLYNFLDKWTFSLDGSFLASSIVAAIDFRDSTGESVLFGITNLQVNLMGDAGNASPIVSWVTVSAPVQGLEQTVALTPPTALSAGAYTLEVRGNVTQPGAYAGSLLAQPVQAVPLPSSLALVACGILALGFTSMRLRRR